MATGCVFGTTRTDPSDTIASVDFGAAFAGVTFNYNPATGEFGMASQLGVNGVTRAAASPNDIGSPGRIRGPAASPMLQARLVNGKMRVEFNAVAGRRYTLELRDDLGESPWTQTANAIEATADMRVIIETDASADARFYRLRVE